ncbi:MAG: hypothetical protein HS116_09900 [Planctomycetes bacterium]|nr:hypothetical protein [Planctomycetota bacterium]
MPEPLPSSTPPRVEVRPLDEPAPASRHPRGLSRTVVLVTGLVVGLLLGGVGLGYSFADGRSPAGPSITEEVFLEYRADPAAPAVKWADLASAPDTFLLVRFQSEPEIVHVTPLVQDDPGFPNPAKLTLTRRILNGEKAYVYLFDDDSASDAFWKDLSQRALKDGGTAAGRLAGVWTLGQFPQDQLVSFCDQAGKTIGEMTLDGNDCLAWAETSLKSGVLDFSAQSAEALVLADAKGRPAGELKVTSGHREAAK